MGWATAIRNEGNGFLLQVLLVRAILVYVVAQDSAQHWRVPLKLQCRPGILQNSTVASTYICKPNSPLRDTETRIVAEQDLNPQIIQAIRKLVFNPTLDLAAF